jgi:oligopeptide/dipeptide ABC transporter ATP-binding protein
LSAQPSVDFSGTGARQRILLEGEVPSPANPPSGCRFRTRCWKAVGECAETAPTLTEGETLGHQAACYFPER